MAFLVSRKCPCRPALLFLSQSVPIFYEFPNDTLPFTFPVLVHSSLTHNPLLMAELHNVTDQAG
jgi:hypothetical protein